MNAKNPSAPRSNIRLFICVALLSTNLALSGCVTTALWNAAEGTPGTAHGIKIRRVTNAFRSDDGKTANVCMAIYDFGRREEREVTLGIPVQDKKKWQIQRSATGKADGANYTQANTTPNVIAPTYIEYVPSMSALMPGCVANGARLPVFDSVAGDAQKNPQANRQGAANGNGQKIADAIYVVNREGLPVNIGYISDRPLYENSYSIDVPLHYISDQAGTGGNPYLYLLTPVTVVMDAAIVVLYVAASAYSGSGIQYHNQQAPLMIKANPVHGISK